MKRKDKEHIKIIIDNFLDFYKFDLNPYNKAYKVWFDHNLHKEIIIDFLKKMKIPTSVRLHRCNTRTKEQPGRVGYIILNTENPLLFLSKEFKETRFDIYIDTSRYYSFENFICTLIHELAHLVLHSTFNNHRKSEVATDLFVMCFGLYNEIDYILNQHDGADGYLKREQAVFAKKYILLKKDVLNSKGLNKFVNKIKLQLI